jgi:HK97 family phage prohead protease
LPRHKSYFVERKGLTLFATKGVTGMKHELLTLLPEGAFQGYASLFGVPDLSGEIVTPGAFRASLRKRGPRGIKLLYQHEPSEPIGVWEELEEDNLGLFVRGRILLTLRRGRDVINLIREGAIDGLSIGFRAEKDRRDPRTGNRRLDQIDLWEISVVTFPLLPGARIGAVKSGARSLSRASSRKHLWNISPLRKPALLSPLSQ